MDTFSKKNLLPRFFQTLLTNFLNVCDVFSKCTDTFSLKKSTLFLNIYGHPALKLGQPILQGGGGFSSRSGHSQGGGLSGVRPFSTGGGVGGAFNCGQAILQGCCGGGGGGGFYSVYSHSAWRGRLVQLTQVIILKN